MWTELKNELHEAIVEAAMEMETIRDETMGYRTDALRLAEEKFSKACTALGAERREQLLAEEKLRKACAALAAESGA